MNMSKKKRSTYIGVSYDEGSANWRTSRWSKEERKNVHNGSYRDEETAAHASDTLARKLMTNGERNLKLNFPDDNTEVHKKERGHSKYIGVYYFKNHKIWLVQRWSKTEYRKVNNGYYKDENTAAHASDTLARILMAKGEQNHKLNFPDNNTEVHKKTKGSKYFGVSYNEKKKMWVAQRWSKTRDVSQKLFSNGHYRDEQTAAHASDTLARKLMANGKQNLKLNFPDDSTELHGKTKTKHSKYFGVSYHEKNKKWITQRYCKSQKKVLNNGTYRDEETAARASDTLARKLMTNGEHNLKLNFPDDNTEVHKRQTTKRKRPFDFEYFQENENSLGKFEETKKLQIMKE